MSKNPNTKVSYHEFLLSKKHSGLSSGFDPVYMPDSLFDFQKEVVRRSVKKGRYAIFADTGLGKTRMQLVIAQNVVEKTNGIVLILTALAVAFQFVKEAEKIDLGGVYRTKDGTFPSSAKIVLCNYERMHLLKSSDFQGVLMDESSILKNFKGQIKGKVNSFVKKIPYRFAATATPSPNDFIELGTTSEALGHLGYMDMLGKFFKNNNNTSDSRSRNIGEKFYLKPHAELDFFAWVSDWSVMVKMPSDLGFSNERYNLPPLIENDHFVKNQSLIDLNGQVQMFTPIARTQTEVRHEQKQTVKERCEKAVELAAGKTSVYWCNRIDESDLLSKLDPEAVEIKGGMSIDQKEDALMAFANGEFKRLITKPKITSFGLNWQHCNHTVFFPTFSYEQYYQSYRRFYRFGQTKEVTVDRVMSDGQRRVIQAIEQKTAKAKELYEKLIDGANRSFENQIRSFNQGVELPKFL